jgi:hypothetical protein
MIDIQDKNAPVEIFWITTGANYLLWNYLTTESLPRLSHFPE